MNVKREFRSLDEVEERLRKNIPLSARETPVDFGMGVGRFSRFPISA